MDATITEVGWLAECPRAHQKYIGATFVHDRLPSGRRIIWLACHCCDAAHQTGAARNRHEPGFHVYLIDEIRCGGD